ncbi:MAG TPA: class I SAM-dependent methyltransferase [Candidatus Acidoferrales bacterium]|nr:class I SAM-dependent methyltransferase [Candidatus Acidoferrales bacterium]
MSSYDWDSDYESGDFRHWEPNASSSELAALVAAGLIDENAKVLDAGCGGGLDSVFLAQCGLRVMGVDLSKRALEIARERAEGARVEVDWLVGSVLGLPVRAESFDLVTDRGLFHVIEDVDRLGYSSEMFRVLRPSGCIVIRGASEEIGQDRFNPITDAAVDKAFPKSRWRRGAVVPILLSSSAGTIDARIVMLQKTE